MAAQRTAAAVPLTPMEQAQLEPRLQRARRALGFAGAAAAWADGYILTMEQAIAEALADSMRATSGNASSTLTRREHQVAALVARGYTNRQIAEALVITERTVDTHLERIFAKLDLHARAQLARWVGGLSPVDVRTI